MRWTCLMWVQSCLSHSIPSVPLSHSINPLGAYNDLSGKTAHRMLQLELHIQDILALRLLHQLDLTQHGNVVLQQCCQCLLHCMLRILVYMQICRTFAQTGACRYGKRCRFIHPDTSSDLDLLPNTPPQTDYNTLYLSPNLAKEPCSQHCCSSIVPPSISDRSYASPQAIPQYSGLHPATYQDHFLRPVPVTSQAAHLATSPYTTPYSPSPLPVTSDVTHFETSPYTSPYSSSTGSVLGEHAYSLLAQLPAGGNADAVNSGLLGSGYSAQEPAGLVLGETAHGGQIGTSPRGVLEYAAMQGCGYSSGEHGANHSQVGLHGPNCTLMVETLHNAICYFWLLALLACAAMCTQLNFDAFRIQTAKQTWLLWHSELIMQNS